MHFCGIFKSNFLTIILLTSFSISLGFDKANDYPIFIRKDIQTHANFRVWRKNVTHELLCLGQEILGIETFPPGGRRKDIRTGKLWKPARLLKLVNCRKFRKPVP